MAYKLDAADVDHQRALLQINRRTATIQIRQLAMHDPRFVPPGIVFGIRNALDQISRIKSILREADHPVDDVPGVDDYDLSDFE